MKSGATVKVHAGPHLTLTDTIDCCTYSDLLFSFTLIRNTYVLKILLYHMKTTGKVIFSKVNIWNMSRICYIIIPYYLYTITIRHAVYAVVEEVSYSEP